MNLHDGTGARGPEILNFIGSEYSTYSTFNVQPSLNDSMLVEEGLVEETALPLPVHSAHDIQVGTLLRALPY